MITNTENNYLMPVYIVEYFKKSEESDPVCSNSMIRNFEFR